MTWSRFEIIAWKKKQWISEKKQWIFQKKHQKRTLHSRLDDVQRVWYDRWKKTRYDSRANVRRSPVHKLSQHHFACVMSHMWMRHVTNTNESCHTREEGIARMWMSHVTCMNESCHTYEWVMSHLNESCHTLRDEGMSHIWMSHVTHMRESCDTYEWVMSHIWMSHVTHMNESCDT